jgi:uncharacterized membrane protein YdbT with pleckstrin-like domain
MAYIDRILEPGEEIRYRATISWTTYAPSILLALGALAAFIAAEAAPKMEAVGFFVGVVLLLGATALFLPAWLRRHSTEIAVTNRRVILKRGLIRRHTVEMNMQKVESVDVDQTLAGRLFDYGSITIRGTGSTFERLRMVDSPLRLRTTVTTAERGPS